MALQVIRGPDNAPLDPLRGRTIAVLGFGNQGAAHARNLRESGLEVVVGARAGSSAGAAAAEEGFDVRGLGEATAAGDLVILALPDEAHGEVWTGAIAPVLRSGATIGVLHGFSLRYGLIAPPGGTGVVMVAPKGPGATLRARYARGEGIPCLFAVHQDSAAGDAEALGLAWAAGIGCARAAIVRTTVADETETDLFGEQAVLCGGMTALMIAAFETLVEAGYPPALSYMECCQEVKQVADLVYERGLSAMMRAISNTAEFGAWDAGDVVVDDAVRGRMRDLLADVRSGVFAERLIADHAAGAPRLDSCRAALAAAPVEAAGADVRSWMPWLGTQEH
jgi:ketol-acid reductoisomerase